MKKILINRNRIPVMQFERTLKAEQELYNEALNILDGTNISIDDENVLNKLLSHYVEPLNINAENPLKLLPLTEDSNNYYRVKEILGSLTFDFEVYTESGKELHIESMFEYAETDEEIQEYNDLKKIAEMLESKEIKRPLIEEILRPWVFKWNPYDQSEIQIKKHHLVEGIQSCKDRKKSRLHHIEQRKKIEAKKAMAKT